MSHLILTTSEIAAYHLRRADLANVVIGFRQRFVHGKLPSQDELATLLGPRLGRREISGRHWLDDIRRSELDGGDKDSGIVDFCDKFDAIELWVDPEPNDQLILIWLLDTLRPHREIISKLSLVQTDDSIGHYASASVAKWRLPVFKITDGHLALASRAWQAYCASTPENWFDLLLKDLMILPRLRSAVIALLEELPDRLSGLGASEVCMLEYLEVGGTAPMGAVHAGQQRDVFNEQEAGKLLDELAQCPAPALFGLGDPPFDMREEARYRRFAKGKIALTELGRAALSMEDDVWRHNPIQRWWGGTLLTSDQLWRWDPACRCLIAPTPTP
jgi:hypothetical protein